MPSFSINSAPISSSDSDKAPKGKAQMNSVLSPASPLFLPLNQLNPHCSRLLNSLQDGTVSKKELINLEQNLWKEVKKLRALQDKANIFTYLIGYYHTILFQLVKFNESDDIFQYHILIRLGDLNRYLERLDTAEYYYCNARNLFPNYGHAYNQLGLLTRSDNFYKCCYYYARAAKSTKRPLEKNLAESNLRIVVREHENSILNFISNDDPSISVQQEDQSNSQLVLPETAFDWFYVMVVAIYFDNIQPVAKPFIAFMTENFSTQRATILRDGIKTTTINCDRDSYLLLASLDILLDWSRLGRQGKAVCLKISNQLLQMRTCLSSIINSLKCSQNQEYVNEQFARSSIPSPLESTSTRPFSGPGNSTPLSPSCMNVSDSSSTPSTKASQSTANCSKAPALPHDCVLKGFKPLDSSHEGLQFPRELPVFNGSNGKLDEFGGEHLQEKSFIGPEQLMQILSRVKSKIDTLGPIIKRKTRNIALESILSSMSSCNSDL